MNITRIEIIPGYWVEYLERCWTAAEADDLLARLPQDVELTNEVIQMPWETITTKRLTAQFGAEYKYNPTAKPPLPWHKSEAMLDIRNRMEQYAGELDGGLIQCYPTGAVPLGWHQDKGSPEIIASASFGAERTFCFGKGPVVKCKEVFRMPLAHGSLLLIPAATNEVLKHRVPAQKRVKGMRINVTLRRFPKV